MSTERPKLGTEAVSPPSPDLSGMLPRRRTARRTATPPEQAEQPPAEQAPAKDQEPRPKPQDDPQPERQEQEKTPTVPASQRVQGPRINRVVYLPDPLFRQVGAACAEQRITRTQLVLQAVEATYPQLEELIAQDLAPHVIKGTLFDTVVTSSRQQEPAKRQMMIQLTAQQAQVLDSLVPTCGARNRSHLVQVALSAHLQPSTT